jgi:hypothetical protein
MTQQELNEEKEMELINAIESLQEIKERAIRLLEETTEILGSPALNGKLRHFEAYGSYGLDQFIGGSSSNPYDSSINTIIEEIQEEQQNL